MLSQPFSRLNVILISLSLAGITPFYALPIAAQTTVSTVQTFNIPAGNFDQVLNRFGLEAGLELYLDGALLQGQTSPGLQGQYTAHEGLRRLLADTGLVAIQQADGAYRVGSATAVQQQHSLADTDNADAVQLDAINVFGSGFAFTRDEQGHNEVYDLDTSTSYLGKVEIERYKGTTPSDLLQGIPGVFSGEARNSGALDLNIRGIQGPGRVPVTIDGTEQALTVWRGYNGATNRNYIDPNLISNVQIYKGSGVVRDVDTGVGGAMVVNTLSVNDIVKPGEDFGLEFKVEGSSNAVKERIPALSTGEDYRNVPTYPQTNPSLATNDDSFVLTPNSGGGGYNALSGEDYAYRLAIGKKTDVVDFMAAYAYRERGNYYAGNNNIDYYNTPMEDAERDYITSMAQFWQPGDEVLNTSSQMESWLLKSTFHLTDDQELELGYRDSSSTYGEIMPSRISRFRRGTVQWPLSHVDAQAYNLKYTYKPESNQWVDFHANIWRTDTESETYSKGGFPNYTDYNPNTGTGDPILRNTAVTQARHLRNGITASNKMTLTDTLDLTLGGKFQYEKLRSNDDYDSELNAMIPRAGRRNNWEGDFSLNWKPTRFLEFNGGMRYTSYWAFDDFLSKHEGEITTQQLQHYNVEYEVRRNFANEQEKEDWIRNTEPFQNYQILVDMGVWTQAFVDNLLADQLATTPDYYDESTTVAWNPDNDGNYDRANNPCLNGSLDEVEVTNCRVIAQRELVEGKAKDNKDHGWVPHLGVTAHINDYSRVYFRYSEDLRFPSLFESTIGFSASLSQYDLKPEHNRTWELAYVHNLAQWLPKAEVADFKVAYYQSLTRDVIERDNDFRFDNIEKQTIRGIELSGRYDNGRFFTDIGLNYQLENEVCDESLAAQISNNDIARAQSDPVPKCMKYGFPSGYLLTQATPELSANLSVGGRFFNRKLELGSRITYYKEYENKDLEWYESNSASNATTGYVYFFNIPFSWGNTTLLDAYARYNVNDDISIELVGTNLTDQYYVDPATRSAVAAPGRSIRLGLTARF
ncbi:TonB-dependent receptor [Nitrincola iocasae]|uniref:TonB-dependent receptor plug domain-containing protein n=1 Tax=Nitrincola iocasae TaxID=2614693 RepID=A0A5J6LAL5_9GAMM|nr:TonB-dependent receptor [Nitrincola iocasae]QEW05674.1 TonB-dependent receptor plug domain-containing protein [Nitrincola iocasae]